MILPTPLRSVADHRRSIKNMKNLACLLFLLGSLASSHAQPKGQDIAVGVVFKEISGTVLSTYESIEHTSDDKWTRHKFSIGRHIFSPDGSTSTFTPLFSFPPLENDWYEVKLVETELLVSLRKTQKQVLSISLSELDPKLLRKED